MYEDDKYFANRITCVCCRFGLANLVEFVVVSIDLASHLATPKTMTPSRLDLWQCDRIVPREVSVVVVRNPALESLRYQLCIG